MAKNSWQFQRISKHPERIYGKWQTIAIIIIIMIIIIIIIIMIIIIIKMIKQERDMDTVKKGVLC